MFDEANAHRRCALRRAQLGLHIYAVPARVCAVLVHAPRHPAAQSIFTYQSDDGLSPGGGTALSVGRPREGTRIFLAFPPVADIIRWLSNG